MAYLAVVLILVGLLAAANLLLTVGVIRRLREHTAQLGAMNSSGADDIALPAGSRVGSFTADSLDGQTLDLSALGDRALVGFFSPHCSACEERLPQFVAHTSARADDLGPVLAVIAGSEADSVDLARELRKVATVFVEPERGPVQEAFGVNGYPAFLLVRDGVVAASSYLLDPVIADDTGAVPAAG